MVRNIVVLLAAFVFFSPAWSEEAYFHVEAEYQMGEADSRLIASQKVLQKLKYQAAEKAGHYVESIEEFSSQKGMIEKYRSVTAALVRLDNISQRYLMRNGQFVLKASARAIVEKEVMSKILKDKSGGSVLNDPHVMALERRNQDLQKQISQLEKISGRGASSATMSKTIDEYIQNVSDIKSFIDKESVKELSSEKMSESESRLARFKKSFFDTFKNSDVSVSIQSVTPVMGEGSRVVLNVDWSRVLLDYDVNHYFNHLVSSTQKKKNYFFSRDFNQGSSATNFEFASNTFVAIEIGFGGEKRYVPIVYPATYNPGTGCSVNSRHLTERGSLDDYLLIYERQEVFDNFCAARSGLTLLSKNTNDKTVSFILPNDALKSDIAARWIIASPTF